MLTRTLHLFLLFILFSGTITSQEISSFNLENLSDGQKKTIQDVLSDKNNSIYDNYENIEVVREESTIKSENTVDPNFSANKKFGYDFIATSPTSVFATGDLPLPNEYVISLRDQISIILSGARDAIFNLPVKLDGTILFPELGSITVAGKTLSEVKENISSLIDTSYIGVEVDISIKELSAKKISIVGAVKTPGTYLVNPFSTITSALAYSGGISEIGSLRNIKLIRVGGEFFYFDLYKLLIEGDRSNDLTIEAGDVIMVEPAGQFVNLSGEVIRPAIYELKDNEDLKDLIEFGLGLTGLANSSNISLKVIDISSSSIDSKNTDDLSYGMNNVIAVNIFPYVNKPSAGVSVLGAVKEPGFYELSENITLAEIIDNLEFINVYPWLAVLEQFDENNLVKSSVLFSLKDPSTYKSLKLLPNSKIFFSDINNVSFDADNSTKALIEDYSLVINHKEDSYSMPVYGNFDVKSFVDYLGIDMSDVEREATYISPLENKVVKTDYTSMFFKASKYHTLTFRSPINDLINVSISGAVDFPGLYTIQSNTTLQDFYNLVGNFKEEAYEKGIVFSRESVRKRQLKSIEKSKMDLRESIISKSQEGDTVGDIEVIIAISENIEPENLGRIAGNFIPNSSSAKKMVLLDGDTIFVPKNPNVINVLGEVLNPLAFEYTKNSNIWSAISSAGGFKDYADESKIYVIKANGMIVKQRKNRFQRLATFGIFPRRVKLEPGDTIIVPRQIISQNRGLQPILSLTQVLSNLAFAAAAIDSLRNN